MNIKNSPSQFGIVSILIHWVMACLVFGLFFLGLYIVELTYYHPHYKTAPSIHKTLGILVFFLTIIRILWHLKSRPPSSIASLQFWEIILSKIAHKLLYFLLITTTVSGYFISTAKGQGISLFGFITVPALPINMPQQEDISGRFHYISALGLFFLALIHGLAALKHHFWDRDATLRRMLGYRNNTFNS